MPLEVWKYPIDMKDFHLIDMPLGAQILCFQFQKEVPTIWALVNPSKDIEKVARRFRFAGTGHTIDETGLQYIGTIQMLNGNLVYHLFEY